MGRGGKKGGRGRGGGAHFAATSAEEIAIRNARLEEFDKERLQKRKEKQEEAGTGPAKKDDGEGEEEVFEGMESAEDVGARLAEQTLNDEEDEQQYKPKGLEGIIETANPNAIKAVHGIKIKDMDKTAAAPMSRKEREAKEKVSREIPKWLQTALIHYFTHPSIRLPFARRRRRLPRGTGRSTRLV